MRWNTENEATWTTSAQGVLTFYSALWFPSSESELTRVNLKITQQVVWTSKSSYQQTTRNRLCVCLRMCVYNLSNAILPFSMFPPSMCFSKSKLQSLGSAANTIKCMHLMPRAPFCHLWFWTQLCFSVWHRQRYQQWIICSQLQCCHWNILQYHIPWADKIRMARNHMWEHFTVSNFVVSLPVDGSTMRNYGSTRHISATDALS